MDIFGIYLLHVWVKCFWYWSIYIELIEFIFYFRKGAYRDDNGKPVVLESVREAERRIAGGQFMW